MNEFIGAKIKNTRFAKIKAWDEVGALGSKFNFPFTTDIAFDPLYSLNQEDGEVYSITMTDENIETYLKPYSQIIDSTSSTTPITKEELRSIKSIFYIKKCTSWTTETKNIFFCRSYPKNYIETPIISCSLSWVTIKDEDGLGFSYKADAYFDESTKKLYFHKFDIIKPMFPWIEEFYRAATDTEIIWFIDTSLFSTNSCFHNSWVNLSNIWLRNKKKITYLIDKGIETIMQNPLKIEEYKTYATECELDFTLHTDWKFVIWDDKELDQALNILMERYYKTHILEEKIILAESVKEM